MLGLQQFILDLVKMPKVRQNSKIQETGKVFWEVFNLVTVFRYFPTNKSRKQNAETEQARPQLQFAQKNIEIHLVVLENELIEVCILVSKKY